MPTIRREAAGDAAAVREVLTRAFGGDEEADLVDRLRRRGRITISLVALEKGRVVGNVLFTPVTIGQGDQACSGLGLGPMAVLPEFQRTGVGTALVRHALEICRRSGHVRIVVLGHPSYYRRFGFVTARDHGIRTTFEAPVEAFMVLALEPGALDRASGVVRYLPEFEEAGGAD